MERMLDGIERLGNKMPDPAILFLWLCIGVIVLSQILYLARRQGHLRGRQAAARGHAGDLLRRLDRPGYVGPTEPAAPRTTSVTTETAAVKGLLTGDGVRFLFTSFVDNFRNFAALAIILVVMIGVGLAEAAGLIGALIRKLVAVSSGEFADVHHRAARDDLQRRLRRRLPGADTAGRGRVHERRAATRWRASPRRSRASAAGFGVNFLITPSTAC